jgi:hypothetical protein
MPQYNCMPPPTTPVPQDILFGEHGDFMSVPQSSPPSSGVQLNENASFIPVPSTNQVGPSNPILDMNFDENSPTGYHPVIPTQEVGCQLSTPSISPVVIKEAKKLSIPHYDPAKMSWSSFAMKLHASLIECDLGYLLREPSTNSTNATHSKELMLELFKKLQGSALNLFTGLAAQRFYLEGGKGIEMVKRLVDKFHPMDDRAIQAIISSMQSLVLADTEDLSSYRDKLENYNLQLSWVGQEMSLSFLVYLAQSQLSKSRYKTDIELLQMSHTASGTSFKSLDDLCQGLERLDKLRGLPYGGAAPSSKITVPGKPNPNGQQPPKRPTPVGFVSHVQGEDGESSSLEMHKDA